MAVLLDYALCTVNDVKELLGIDAGDSSKNNLIIRRINQATVMIENYTGRRFKATDWVEEYDASGTDQLILKQRPINSITYVQRRDSSLNEDDFETVDTEDYFYDSKAGLIEGVSSFFGSWNRYKISYNAGYTTLPADIVEACASLAAFYVDNGTSGTNVKKKQEGQRSIEYFDPNAGAKNQSLIEQLGLDEILNSYSNYPVLADK